MGGLSCMGNKVVKTPHIVERDWKFYKGYGLIEDKLFNMKSVSMERRNVLESNPELGERMHGKLDRWLEKVSVRMPKK